MKFTLLLIAVIIVLPGVPCAEETCPTLIPFTIKDQHGAHHTERRFADSALLAVWADRRGSDFMMKWCSLLTDSLRTEIADAELRRIDLAHTKGAPFFVKGRIRDRFRRDFPDPVLLDWKGIFAKTYACAADSCTILLFDDQGKLARRWTVGDPNPVLSKEITEAARRTASFEH